ncbi:MAG: hypothetical protein OET79_04410 [Nitrospirota bacterium]|nr:hypothetical protein [Nitrospirota bacterium]
MALKTIRLELTRNPDFPSGHHWAFHYDDAAEDDEPIFRFDQHRFVRGDYVSITEHDGIQRTFRVADIR